MISLSLLKSKIFLKKSSIYVNLKPMVKETTEEKLIEPRVYELGYLLVSSLQQEEVTETLDSLRKELLNLGAKFISEGEPELIDLAYTMSVNEGGKHTKYDKAYFGWMKFELEPQQVLEFEQEVLKFNKNVLRYIIVKTVKEETRAQLKQEALEALNEVKNEEAIAPAPTEEKGELSDEEIDKAVEELLKQPEVAQADILSEDKEE